MKKPAYIYRGRVVRVVDGDTCDLLIDVGFRTGVTGRFRLHGIDTPEKNSKVPAEREAAFAAEQRFVALLTEAGEGDFPLVVETFKDPDSFGRWLARITLPDGTCVNDKLIEEGHAVVFKRS